ncbi:HalOD1 output domain-containing protein [Natrinema halophilum]|uniref:Halobacterial output domain-containing protein n=1 Tax=Natrinema halophilum TaxID=1699371 RepID=A0A7D5KXN9_9EURY|nr:HalOD1 output domain-containing protein [Natrinema halophilum]QLG49342.1 hypothetical protein HYG82_10945 [Natrinema halophilum]
MNGTHQPSPVDPTLDARTGTYEQQYETADGSEILIKAIRSVAAVAGVSTTDIDPLGEAADPEILVGSVEAADTNGGSTDGVTVRIYEHDVTIDDGRIVIDPPADEHSRCE